MAETSLLQLVVRWWRILLAGVVLGGVAGLVVALVLPKTYESTATLLVGPINASSNLDASGSLAATYQDLATSRPVLVAALRQAGSSISVDKFADDVKATSNTVTRIVTVTVSDKTPDGASKLATAIADRLQQATNAQPGAASDQLTAFAQDPAVTALPQAAATKVEQAAARAFGAQQAGRLAIVSPAVPPLAAASPRKPLLVILGALAGLIIAFLVAVLRGPAETARPATSAAGQPPPDVRRSRKD